METAVKEKVSLKEHTKLIEDASTNLQTAEEIQKRKDEKKESIRLAKKMEERLDRGKVIVITAEGKEGKVPEGMTADEKKELENLETIIKKGYSSFYSVGTALITIRDKRLYRENFDNFQDYCREKWNMNRGYAYKIIGSSTVVDKLSTLCPEVNLTEATESTLRPIVDAKLTDQQMKKVIKKADKTAKKVDGKITAKIVKAAVKTVIAPKETKTEIVEKEEQPGEEKKNNSPSAKKMDKFVSGIEVKLDTLVETIDDKIENLSKENKKSLIEFFKRTYESVKENCK